MMTMQKYLRIILYSLLFVVCFRLVTFLSSKPSNDAIIRSHAFRSIREKRCTMISKYGTLLPLRPGWYDDDDTYLVNMAWVNSSAFVLQGFRDLFYDKYSHTFYKTNSSNTTLTEVKPVKNLLNHFAVNSAECGKIYCVDIPNIDSTYIDLVICRFENATTPVSYVSDKYALSASSAKNTRPVVGMVAAVTSYTPHSRELFNIFFRNGGHIFYLGVCGNRTVYEAYNRISKLYNDRRVQVFHLNFKGSEEGKFNNVIMCRNVAYQVGLYNSKRDDLKYLIVSDFDEIFLPRKGYDYETSILSSVVSQFWCYINVHGDVGIDTKVVSNKLEDRYQEYCYCGDPFSSGVKPPGHGNMATSCGFAYVKSIANVKHTYWAGVHAHGLACSLSWNQRVSSSKEHLRPWADNMHSVHLASMWKPRSDKCSSESERRKIGYVGNSLD